MNASRSETVPQTWDDALDPVFFRITAGLFPTGFCLGATVLLAANDPAELGPPLRRLVELRAAAPR